MNKRTGLLVAGLILLIASVSYSLGRETYVKKILTYYRDQKLSVTDANLLIFNEEQSKVPLTIAELEKFKNTWRAVFSLAQKQARQRELQKKIVRMRVAINLAFPEQDIDWSKTTIRRAAREFIILIETEVDPNAI